MKPVTQLPDGSEYWPLDPNKCIPSIDNIAHKLAQTNRFGGSCIFPYSVAQHLEVGARSLIGAGYSKRVALAFLFHDAAEPLGLGDLPAPIKYGAQTSDHQRFVIHHQLIEGSILETLLRNYNVTTDTGDWAIVKEYDTRILSDEKRQVMNQPKFDWGAMPSPLGVEIKELHWQEAKDNWIAMYYELKEESA